MKTKHLLFFIYPLVFLIILTYLCVCWNQYTDYGISCANQSMKNERLNLEQRKCFFQRHKSINQDYIESEFSDSAVAKLCIAVDNRDMGTIDYLLSNGKKSLLVDGYGERVNPNSLGHDDMTVLLWAFYSLIPSAIGESLYYPDRTNLTEDDYADILQMYLDDRLRCIERLLWYGADPNIKYAGQKSSPDVSLYEGISVTILAAARFRPYSEKIQINLLPSVLKYGGDPNIVYPKYNVTPIFLASSSYRGKLRYLGGSSGMCVWPSPYNVGLLIDAGADIEHRDKWQNTPLIAATGGENFDVVLMLLEAGADYTAENEDGQNLAYFLYVAKHNNPKIDTEESIDPYYNKVIAFLKDKEYSLENAWEKLRDQLKKLPPPPENGNTRNSNQRPYDPFADEWINKRNEKELGL